MVEFRMFPHPNEQSLPPLEKDYMCSLEYCKCMVLKKYLASRLKAQLPRCFPAAPAAILLPHPLTVSSPRAPYHADSA